MLVAAGLYLLWLVLIVVKHTVAGPRRGRWNSGDSGDSDSGTD
ncbi:hypothetical protein NWFMUON74_52340 [Nocardia wallacei]|uniref:Uncharacterized protein n=1 Tax=Nocardia wallacei TaxID=480035 RepID=A0A7G1KQL4_9NOCA|nr:hypothetical protein NWFMUON74_52340 [Nocardia wallacei]